LDKSLLFNNYQKTLYAYTIVLGYLLRNDEWNTLLDKLKEIDDKQKLLTFRNYGFDSNWLKRLNKVTHFI